MENSVLDIQSSARGRQWVFRHNDDDHLSDYMQSHGLDLITARLMVGRNIAIESVPLRSFYDGAGFLVMSSVFMYRIGFAKDTDRRNRLLKF